MDNKKYILYGAAGIAVVALVLGIFAAAMYYSANRRCPACDRPLGFHAQTVYVDGRTYHFGCVFQLKSQPRTTYDTPSALPEGLIWH